MVNADFFEQIEKWRKFYSFRWGLPFKRICRIDPASGAAALKWLALNPSFPSTASTACLPVAGEMYSSLLVSREAFVAAGGFDAEFVTVGGPGSGMTIEKLNYLFPLESPAIETVELFRVHSFGTEEWQHVVFSLGRSAHADFLSLPGPDRLQVLRQRLNSSALAGTEASCPQVQRPGSAVHPKMSAVAGCLQARDNLREACVDDARVRNWCILCEDEQWDHSSRSLRFGSCPSIQVPVLSWQPDVIVGILSAPKNAKLRHAVRQTWTRLGDRQRVGCYFILGRSEDAAANEEVAAEARTCSDIFLCLGLAESYRSISAKALACMDWVVDSANAPHVEKKFGYLMKCDGDSFVRLDRMLRMLDGNVGADAKRFYWGWDHGP